MSDRHHDFDSLGRPGVQDMFELISIQSRRCSRCKFKSKKYDKSNIYELPIGNANHLEQILGSNEEYMDHELICGK